MSAAPSDDEQPFLEDPDHDDAHGVPPSSATALNGVRNPARQAAIVRAAVETAAATVAEAATVAGTTRSAAA